VNTKSLPSFAGRGPRIIGYRKNGVPIREIMGGAADIEIMPELRGKSADTISETPEELRGRTPDELEQYVEVLDAHLRSIHVDEDTGELRDKSPAEQAAFDYGLKLRDVAINRIENHRAVQEVFRRRPRAVQTAMLNLGRDRDDAYGDVRRLTIAEARDRALRVLDDRNAAMYLSSDQKDEVERQLRTSSDIARRILVTENDDYRNAFLKMVTKPNGQMYLSEDERRALVAFDEYRTMSEGTTTAGGFGIPVFIDPSIIMTAQGSDNPFLQIASTVDVNTNAWKGVTSAGVSWSFDAENVEVSDDSPTLAQPTVTVYMARGFVPYSIEVSQDYPNFASEMQTLLGEGYDELLVQKFTAGSGSGEPFGVLTVLSASAGNRVSVQTAGTNFGPKDPYSVWKAVPQRFRRRASWLMSVDVNNAIRQIGTANVFHAYTENLPAEWADMLFGKQTYESPYMPDTTTSTSANSGLAVVGDFRNYKIARRGGMSVEQIPHLFSTTTNLPSGTRGLFAYARIGGNVVNTAGFRLLVNTA
jgi:HK97 family phage major capsid protein